MCVNVSTLEGTFGNSNEASYNEEMSFKGLFSFVESVDKMVLVFVVVHSKR